MTPPPDPGSAAPGQDPSMEDILASIRKILNEEDGPPQGGAPAAGPALAPEAAPAPPASLPAEEPPLDLTEDMLVAPPAQAPEAAPEPAPPPPAPEPPLALPAPEEGLVAPATAAAAAAILGQLARTVAAERSAPVHRAGPSIEDVVREEVRPLLKAWLDAHLPALVERAVRSEIERVVSRSLG